MKTSTTILVIFFAVVFLTPFLVALALTSKMKGGNFKVVKQDAYESSKKFKVADFKVLKLQSNSKEFRCSIMEDDSSFVSYPEWSNDSVSLSSSGDTLMVSYVRTNGSEDIFTIEIHGQDPATIFADKVSVSISPGNYFIDNPLTIHLRNEAAIRFLSSAIQQHDDADAGDEEGTVKHMKFNKVSIHADKSEVRLPAFLHVESLSFDIHNQSKLVFPAGMKYDQLSASVSDDSQLEAPWRVVKEIKTSAGKN
jgi:hypothetical protein